MKITKFQNPAGRLIRVLSDALDQQLSKTGTKVLAGTQNEALLSAVKAFDAKELSKDEYRKIILDWMYKQFPSISSYEPYQLIKFPKYS